MRASSMSAGVGSRVHTTWSIARHSLRNRACLRNDASGLGRASRLRGERLGLCDRAGFLDCAGGGAGFGGRGADGNGMSWLGGAADCYCMGRLGGSADRDCVSGLRGATNGHGMSWLRSTTNCHCVGWL